MSREEESHYKKSEINESYRKVQYNEENCSYRIIGRVDCNGMIRVLFKTKLINKNKVSEDT